VDFGLETGFDMNLVWIANGGLLDEEQGLNCGWSGMRVLGLSVSLLHAPRCVGCVALVRPLFEVTYPPYTVLGLSEVFDVQYWMSCFVSSGSSRSPEYV